MAVCHAGDARTEIVELHPGMKLVEVVFDLSTRVVAGNEADIKHITVEIRSPDRQLLLVGFSPATTMLSESSDGFIEIEEHEPAGQIAIEYGIPSAKIQASAKNAGDSKIVEKKLAPKSLLVSATTIDRSHGVVFKTHPSSQDSLQKSRQFVCQFAVPQSVSRRLCPIDLHGRRHQPRRGPLARQRSRRPARPATPSASISTATPRPGRRPTCWPSGKRSWPVWCRSRPTWPGRRKRLPGGTPSARRF